MVAEKMGISTKNHEKKMLKNANYSKKNLFLKKGKLCQKIKNFLKDRQKKALLSKDSRGKMKACQIKKKKNYSQRISKKAQISSKNHDKNANVIERSL